MLLLLACTAADDGPADSAADTDKPSDRDNDGLPDEADCAPDDPDAGGPVSRHADADGDGYGDPAVTDEVCPDEPGWVDDATDCDDGSAAVYPGAPEIWYDGADEDCSGGSDFDQDGDGYPREADCDDEDPTRYPDPDAPELWYNGVDENCDGNDGDQDGDGWYVAGYPFEVPAAYAGRVSDCWDDPTAAQDPLNGYPAVAPGAVYPGASDTPYDGIDANCDAHDDFDADYDGIRTSAWPDASGAYGTDCDDTNPSVPAPTEDCTTREDDTCDGLTNELDALGCIRFYADGDADGFGVEADPACLCDSSGVYTTQTIGDCDDDDATVHPGRAETCDGVDQDCDGSTDEGVLRYVDADGDGSGGTSTSCSGVSSSGDCDDADAARYPGAAERCDGQDNACVSGWTAADEAGVVSVVSSTGVVSDATATWASGAPTRPVTITLPADATVNVCPGTWYVTLEDPGGGASATVRGLQDGGEVVLDGGDTDQLVYFSDTGSPVLELAELTLQNGYAGTGGCVYASQVQLTLDNVIVQDCEATTYGGGLYVWGGSLVVLDSVLRRNTTGYGGGAIQAEYSSLWIEGSELSDNVAEGSSSAFGAGLVSYPYGYGDQHLADTTFRANYAWSTGTTAFAAGFYFYTVGADNLDMDNVTFEANLAGSDVSTVYAPAAYLYPDGGGNVTLVDSSFLDNEAWTPGTALSGGLTVSGGNGGGTLALSGVRFDGNTIYGGSSSAGGGLIVGPDFYETNLSDCEFTGNRIEDVSSGTEVGYGGAAHMELAGRLAGLTNVVASGNSALEAGGFNVTLRNGVRLAVTTSSFDSNVGDGFRYDAEGTTETLDLDNNVFAGNYGAGLQVYAGGGYDAGITAGGSYADDNDFVANIYGIYLQCGAYGGTCSMVRAYADFVGSWGANTSCDILADTRCYPGIGDDAIVSCTTSGSQTTCS